MTSLQNLFVAKLPRTVTDTELEKIFESYNPKSAKVMLDAATGKSKGFGFVLFDSEEEGELAFKELNKTHVTILGQNFNLCIFPSKHDGKVAKEVSNALYIRNIPMRLSYMEVEAFLNSFGKLTYFAMREDHYGSPVWVVYAEYETVEDAKNALNKLHGNSTYFLGSAALLAKYADTEETKRERRRRRREQHQMGMQGSVTNSYSPLTGSHLGSNLSHSISQIFSTAAEEDPMMMVDRVDVPFIQRYSSFGAPCHGRVLMLPPPPPPPPPPQYSAPKPKPPALAPQPKPSALAPQLAMDVHTQSPIPPLASTFLNVTFPTTASVNSGHSTRMSAVEQCSADRPTSVTPLSFSLGPDAALEGSRHFPPQMSLLGAESGGANTGFSIDTPAPQSGTLSARGSTHYRHNPYALLTPISSPIGTPSPGTPSPGTPSPSTPRGVLPILAGGVLAHFGGSGGGGSSAANANVFSASTSNNTSGFLCSAHGGAQNGGYTGFTHAHFARTSSHGVLATSNMSINSRK